MKSIKFSESVDIKGSPESIFDYTQDYKNRLKWDTFLVEARLLNNAIRPDKGVKAWCVAKNGLGMETQYVSFNRPKVTAIKMTKGPYMFRDFAASWTFAEKDPDMTRVTFTYTCDLRFPYNLITPIIQFVLRKNVKQRLKDLKVKFAESVS
jgi:ribosome-associated toxin RatA of RatAB toxin-antitoxin module